MPHGQDHEVGPRRTRSMVQLLAVEDDAVMHLTEGQGSMALVPDWPPNIHPLLVHFPIALLIAAAVVDVGGWVFPRWRVVRQTATLLYVLGTGAAVVTYFTGRAASQAVWLPGMAQAVVGEHWNWAFRTVWFFGIVTVLRLVFITRRDRGPVVMAAFALAGLLGIGLLVETGDRGGRLVYEHGVGIVRR